MRSTDAEPLESEQSPYPGALAQVEGGASRFGRWAAAATREADAARGDAGHSATAAARRLALSASAEPVATEPRSPEKAGSMRAAAYASLAKIGRLLRLARLQY